MARYHGSERHARILIKRAYRSRDWWLDLDNLELVAIPTSVGRIRSLQRLDVAKNLLRDLPPEVTRLRALEYLDISENAIESLPPEIGDLRRLKYLHLSLNNLKRLSPFIGELAELQTLSLAHNDLATLPPQLGGLSNLHSLFVAHNRLTSLPAQIGELRNLRHLDISGNQLSDLPVELADLPHLTSLLATGNPFPDALSNAINRGIPALRAYLHSLANKEEVEKLYEAKLLIVGEGKVGKSSLLAALHGQPFLKHRDTTHGTETSSLTLQRSGAEPLLCNVWDFGGQIVYRVTNQFFFSRRSLYVLVWDPRQDVERCDVDGWIRRIRLRVGEDARIIIVATHARTGHRMAHLDQSVLTERFGNIIAGFCEVDSGVLADGVTPVGDGDSRPKFGFEPLKKLITSTAGGLPQMGTLINRRWKAAREEVLNLRRRPANRTYITYQEFRHICSCHHLDDQAATTLAGLMHDLGHVLHFAEHDGLRDHVVLQPEWVTKAIGYVLEDPGTNSRHGFLPHNRLNDIWHTHRISGREKYAPELHPFFLRLMELFDVSYRIDGDDADLVAQLVPEQRAAAELPWLPGDPLRSGQRQISLVCALEEEAPGLIPWMICRTHPYSANRQRHWRGGMFLTRSGRDEALLELSGRDLHVTVRALWPDYFASVIRNTIERLIQERWPYLIDKHSFAIPCPKRVGDRSCGGTFDVDSLWQFQAEGDEEIRCQPCRAKVSIPELLTGFARPRSDLVGELDRIIQKAVSEGVEASSAELEARLQSAIMILLRGLGNEGLEGPRLFSLLPESRHALDPRRILSEKFRVNVWCEMPSAQHPLCSIGSGGTGEFVVGVAQEWVARSAPYLRVIGRIMKVLIPGAQVAGAIALDDLSGALGRLDLISGAASAAATTLGDVNGDSDILKEPGQSWRKQLDGEALRAVQAVVLDVAKQNNLDPWGGLRRTASPTGEFLWLCPHHHAIYDPPPPRLAQQRNSHLEGTEQR